MCPCPLGIRSRIVMPQQPDRHDMSCWYVVSMCGEVCTMPGCAIKRADLFLDDAMPSPVTCRLAWVLFGGFRDSWRCPAAAATAHACCLRGRDPATDNCPWPSFYGRQGWCRATRFDRKVGLFPGGGLLSPSEGASEGGSCRGSCRRRGLSEGLRVFAEGLC